MTKLLIGIGSTSAVAAALLLAAPVTSPASAQGLGAEVTNCDVQGSAKLGEFSTLAAALTAAGDATIPSDGFVLVEAAGRDLAIDARGVPHAVVAGECSESGRKMGRPD